VICQGGLDTPASGLDRPDHHLAGAGVRTYPGFQRIGAFGAELAIENASSILAMMMLSFGKR
jgi:hypothetical protein